MESLFFLHFVRTSLQLDQLILQLSALTVENNQKFIFLEGVCGNCINEVSLILYAESGLQNDRLTKLEAEVVDLRALISSRVSYGATSGVSGYFV